MSCPFAAILGRESRFYSPPLQEHYLKLFGRDNVVTIEEAGHHPYLDQPRAVVRGLTEILDRWSE